jgi:hypothetical protein
MSLERIRNDQGLRWTPLQGRRSQVGTLISPHLSPTERIQKQYFLRGFLDLFYQRQFSTTLMNVFAIEK